MRHPQSDRSLGHAGWQLGVGLLFLGCCPPPPAVTPAAQQQQPAQQPAQQPEPAASAAALEAQPECESTLKGCKSGDTTRLKIQQSDASFHPPTGWTYAKEAEQSVAFSPDRTAMLAFTLAASRKVDDVVEASKKLAERLHIRNVKYAWLTPRLKKTQHELEAGPHTVELWEVNKSSQFGAAPKLEGELAGTYLLVVATVEGQGVFVGTAFVTKPDGDEHAGAVMESLQTFRSAGVESAEKAPQNEPAK